ncbi:16363_t:CDS:2 [Gigaspora margarita]|uniref:16363_t:CDS:1 n=1 Tax=Gigaspora margarita TaxID=4874 RepID=A0ABN7VMU9_GIGMA|nr:16363_t:CDS:2 [Gigaspora margarita]
MQQPDQTQITQKVVEPVKDTTIDGTETKADERHILLNDKLIYFEKDDTTSITSHTKQQMIDTDANSNATIEGWPNIVKTWITNECKTIRETTLGMDKWHYNTIL